MSKKGGTEAVILIAVLVVSILALYFIFKGPGRAAGFNFECIVECQPPKAVESTWFVTTSSQEAQFMCNQYANAQCKPGTRYQSVARATGGFSIPAAKEYGGAVRGIAAPGTRAFPAGRAYELPAQSCYTCSCMTQGITATNQAAAQKVCAENCGGTIRSVIAGAC